MRAGWLGGLLLLPALALAGCGGLPQDTPLPPGGSGIGVYGDLTPSVVNRTGNPGISSAPLQLEAHPPIHVHRFASGAPVGYSPAQIRTAYGFGSLTGAGQTIAIVDAYGSPTIANDLAVFSRQFGLPAASLTIAYPSGKPKRGNAGWALETALDVEWAHAIAPQASILLVVAKSATLSDLLTAVNYAAARANQVSMSWGAGEFSSEALYDSYFSRSGVTYFASSGDSGAGVMWPAVSTRVLGVGGTTLPLDALGNRTGAETAWSGSGGGTSAYIAEPSWQTGWQSSGKRQVPDVSYVADPNTGVAVYSSTAYQGVKGWFQVGGTSAGAPQWAGIMALVNAGRAQAMQSCSLGLYTLATSAYATNYWDITSGSNGYPAVALYDLVTGLGSPRAGSLVPGMTASP